MVEESSGTSSPLTDKRRNKLGYQRTSVACGHCRRRKIRCLLPTPEDLLGRCANCIRLKKECTFFPVDHTPDGRRNTSSSVQDSPSAPLTPSQLSAIDPHPQPPSEFELPTGEVMGNSNAFNLSYQGSRSLSVPYVSSSGGNIPIHPSFTISPLSEQEERPIHIPTHAPPGQVSPYWASEASTPNTGNFPPNLPNLGHDSSASTYENSPLTYPQGDQSWPPSRSLSYSHLEGLHGQFGSFPDLSHPPNIGDPLRYVQPGTPSPAALPPNEVQSAAPLLSNSYQLPSQPTYGQPWLAPSPTDQGSSQWYPEPGSILPTHSNEHIRDQFLNPSPVYPPRSHPT